MSSMRNVIIIGNSSSARECHWLVGEIVKNGAPLCFKGFLAFEGFRGNLRSLAHLEIGHDDDYVPEPDDVFVIGIGSPELRQRAFDKWKQRNASFINLVHPFTTIPPETRMGEANIISCACFFSCDTVIGNTNYFNGEITLGHDVVVGDANFFAPGFIALGNISIGSGNSFGVRSVVLANAKIGDNNSIAPGAFIYKGCKSNCRMAGNPALNIGTVEPT